MATKQPSLRAVGEDERRAKPPTLTEAVESGDVLDMLLAQRRLLADAMATASDSTRPQLNNELNKLHVLIATEQERRKVAAEEARADGGSVQDEAFDASAV